MLGGQAGVAGHVTIADDVVVMGRTMVTHSIKKPGVYAGGGVPMDEAANWRKNAVRFGQLDDMARRLRRVEKAVLKPASDDES
jgi:UDP-3-O-[3-hydroxymyristoyl] glucosamine N-acyltransferase